MIVPLLVTLPVKIAGLKRMLMVLVAALVTLPLMVVVPPVMVNVPLLVNPAPPVESVP